MSDGISYTPGMRVLCRDAEWLVNKVDMIGHNPYVYAIYGVGVDDLVRGHQAVFLTNLDEVIPVDPAKTSLVEDASSGYNLSKLFLEAQLRQIPYTEREPDVNGMGVFKYMQFQVQTVRHALKQLRPRILLADAVGLGKTIQVGMILTELVRRGRASRILVLAKKSMLAQFQSELWNRFNIPLVRLDSTGIARLRLRVPANKNPFEIYHRVIISIDTLKNVSRYEHFLEDTRWDVVIIDEAHNVAGASFPERHRSYRLARMLSRRCDSMILTTATPHNGKRETFGRLISLLDPSAVPDPDFREYNAEDIQNFFLMRFKEDIRYEAGDLLAERRVIDRSKTTADASEAEETVYGILDEMRRDIRSSAASAEWRNYRLIQYGIYKLFLSSPEACLSTVTKRLDELSGIQPETTEMGYLKRLKKALGGLSLRESMRFSVLLKQLEEIGWDGSVRSPRVLIFTEYRHTQDALAESIAEQYEIDYSVKFEAQASQVISTIHGSTPDIHLMATVEAFGTGTAPIRMLIATDVASEGINLHHECHNIIHYDLPWSIITLIQRNGRIDRLGQTISPVLRYIMVNTRQGILNGDDAIFQRLIDKVEEINRLRLSGESVLKIYDPEKEEEHIALNGVIQGDAGILEKPVETISPEAAALERILNEARLGGVDLSSLAGGVDSHQSGGDAVNSAIRLYSDKDFLVDGYRYLQRHDRSYLDIEHYEDVMVITPPDDLKRRLGAAGEVIFGSTAIPDEAWADDGRFRVTDNPAQVEIAIKAARNTTGYWSKELLCNNQHPVSQWLIERLLMQLQRGEAPYAVSRYLKPKEFCFCFIGRVNSLAGTPLIVEPHAVCFLPGKGLPQTERLSDVLARSCFGDLTNTGEKPDLTSAKILLPSAVQNSIIYLNGMKVRWADKQGKLLRAESRRLARWEKERRQLLEGKIKELGASHPMAKRSKKELQWLEGFIKERNKWIESQLNPAYDPVTQLILVLGGPGK